MCGGWTRERLAVPEDGAGGPADDFRVPRGLDWGGKDALERGDGGGRGFGGKDPGALLGGVRDFCEGVGKCGGRGVDIHACEIECRGGWVQARWAESLDEMRNIAQSAHKSGHARWEGLEQALVVGSGWGRA